MTQQTEMDAPQNGSGQSPEAEAPDAPHEITPGSPGNMAFAAGVLGLGVIALIIIFVVFGSLRHWLALHTGTLHGGPDVYYNFWSGFGSDLGEITLITAVCIGVYTGVRKVNCHTRGCWRIGHHELEGTPFILCRHHHPHVPNRGASHDHILTMHRKYKSEQTKGH